MGARSDIRCQTASSARVTWGSHAQSTACEIVLRWDLTLSIDAVRMTARRHVAPFGDASIGARKAPRGRDTRDASSRTRGRRPHNATAPTLNADARADDDANVASMGDASAAATRRPPLNAEQKRALVDQLEFYFGDANVVTDAHLRGMMDSNDDGWVSLAEVCAFNRMRAKLKKRRWEDVAANAVRELGSSVVEVSEDGCSIRRLEPVPDFDVEEIQSRTVVVENAREFTVAALRAEFETCGEVLNVRVRQPGGKKCDVEKPRGLDLIVANSNRAHALVEFSCIAEAQGAVTRLDNPTDWRNGMRVRVLLKPGQKKKAKKVQKDPPAALEDGGDGEKADGEGDEGDGEKAEGEATTKKSKKKKKSKPDYSKWASAAAFRENKMTITSLGGDDEATDGNSGESLEDALPKKLVLTPRSPTMPDGSPGFTRKRTVTPTIDIAKEAHDNGGGE